MELPCPLQMLVDVWVRSGVCVGVGGGGRETGVWVWVSEEGYMWGRRGGGGEGGGEGRGEGGRGGREGDENEISPGEISSLS